ncbi:glycine cleavage system aminomethyltransferase GcvT [Maridesulfovibrio zosterae]|uniref:glycine cleavage system aminomethyltransferase GcvT n=1 Tax=Maridesulfovibrio zosterae TaxID=82171 RepID=UPI0004228698|nr:glycine cleavage system aminomethyltransferase GcvT [Maridesulfovibrio zosterae]
MSALRTTPLTEWHRENGAKLVPFAGFEMPVQYKGIIIEHKHTREKAGVFDISHMGEFKLSGKGAKDALNKLVTQNLDTLAPGKCRYGFLPNDKGGVLDDLIIYCLAEDSYMLVVNGACEEGDFNWINSRLPEGIDFDNISYETAKIDLQGPLALDVLESVFGRDFKHLKYFNFEETEFDGYKLIVSRTGYTGELGYEFYLPADKAQSLWEKIVADERVEPIGLGARDTLRLELGYPLYGHDLDTEHNPREGGYGFLLPADAYTDGKELLIPLSIEGRRAARHGDKVILDGKEVGVVTSGSFSPSLGYSIALAYVANDVAEAEAFIINTGKKELEAKKTELPFYTEGTARKKLD